jgi:hypothetical protein
MRELSRDNTFVVGLRVDEDGDLGFAVGGSIIEIRFAANDEPLALREVRISDAEDSPWQASGEPG